MKCPTCKNEMGVRRVPKRNQGPYGVTVWERETFCPYCEWKGTTGPGKALRHLAKEHNMTILGTVTGRLTKDPRPQLQGLPPKRQTCPYCGCTEPPVEDAEGEYPSCPHCKGV